jgi:signal transduction histidine kinase
VTDGIELVVVDRGHGIPADAAAKLFEAFHTTKPHGMGLGLSIVRSIVDAHGGRVTAAPREGDGSAFTVWLPAVKAATAGRRYDMADDTVAEIEPNVGANVGGHAAEGRHS